MTPLWLRSQTNVFLAIAGSLTALVLFAIWWRQRTQRWAYVLAASLIVALGMAWGAHWLFEAPDYLAGCPQICPGWRGYPAPTALSDGEGGWLLQPAGIIIDVLLHWLALLTLIAFWSAAMRRWPSARPGSLHNAALAGALVLGVWALIPRYAAPPEPAVQGDVQRLGINAKRLATRALGGLDWRVQRLAFEDVRRLPQRSQPDAPGLRPPSGPSWRVCLRSYTFYYIPWRRVYVDLDATGVITIGGGLLPLDQECWSAPFPKSPFPFAVGQPEP